MTDNSVASCPNCSKKLNAPSSAIGKKARCKGCQHVFQLEENVFQETTSASSSIKQCFSCGKNVLPPSVTCSHCGASLESGTRRQIEQPPAGTVKENQDGLWSKLLPYVVKSPDDIFVDGIFVMSWGRGFQLTGLFILFTAVPFNMFVGISGHVTGMSGQIAANKTNTAADEGHQVTKGWFRAIADEKQAKAETASTIANRDLRTAAFAFLIGILFFGLGTAIEFDKVKPFTRNVVSTMRDYANSKEIAEGDGPTKECPHCGGITLQKFVKCKHCGSDFSKDTSEQRRVECGGCGQSFKVKPEIRGKVVKCPKCKTAIQA